MSIKWTRWPYSCSHWFSVGLPQGVALLGTIGQRQEHYEHIFQRPRIVHDWPIYSKSWHLPTAISQRWMVLYDSAHALQARVFSHTTTWTSWGRWHVLPWIRKPRTWGHYESGTQQQPRMSVLHHSSGGSSWNFRNTVTTKSGVSGIRCLFKLRKSWKRRSFSIKWSTARVSNWCWVNVCWFLVTREPWNQGDCCRMWAHSLRLTLIHIGWLVWHAVTSQCGDFLSWAFRMGWYSHLMNGFRHLVMSAA